MWIFSIFWKYTGFPGGSVGKESACNVGEDPLEKEMATHSSTLAWKSHGQRSLVEYSPWGHKESDMTGWLHFHFQFHETLFSH